MEFANRLEARRGLLFLSQIVTGDWQKLVPGQALVQKSLEEFIRNSRLTAVGKVILAEDFEHGVSTLLQVAGCWRTRAEYSSNGLEQGCTELGPVEPGG